MLLDGCDAPLTVWLDCMWVPLGNLILAWYTIDLMNIFTSFFGIRRGPFNYRGARHAGGGKKGRRGGGKNPIAFAASFDPGEWIGDHIPGADDLSHRPVPPGVPFMWTVHGVIERFNYFFMVLDLGSDFVFNWMSSVVKLGYCGNKDDSILLAHRDYYQQIGIFGWSPIVWEFTDKDRKLTFWNSVAVAQITGPGSYYVRFRCKCLDSVGGPGVCGLRIQQIFGVVPATVAQSVITLEPGASAAMALGYVVEVGAAYYAEIIVNGVWEFEDMEVFMQAPWRPLI